MCCVSVVLLASSLFTIRHLVQSHSGPAYPKKTTWASSIMTTSLMDGECHQ